MSKVYAFMADGLEEVECLAVVDILRRGSVIVELVSISDHREVTGAHGITVMADRLLTETDVSDADLLFLPGGGGGTKLLGACAALAQELFRAAEKGKRLAAICAAPSVLGGLGLLKGKRATCYPGFEDKLIGADRVKDGVVTDGNITTARGLGFAIDLGLELIRLLVDEKTSLEVKDAIQYA